VTSSAEPTDVTLIVAGILNRLGRLDVEYLRSMAETLGITDLLDRARAADNAET
jgi:hypothetical protein